MNALRSLGLLVLVALCPDVAGAGQPIRIGIPGITGAEVPQDVLSFYEEHLAQALGRQGIHVLTTSQVQTLLGLQRQRDLLGCVDEESCVSQLGDLLDVEGLLFGEVAQLGQVEQFNLKVISVRDGTLLASSSARVEGRSLVLPLLDRAAERMAREISVRMRRPLILEGTPVAFDDFTSRTETIRTGPRRFSWAPAALGIALGAASTYFFWEGRQAHDRLTTPEGPPLPGAVADRYSAQGKRAQALGLVTATAGGAALLTGGILYGLGGARGTLQGGARVLPGGAAVSMEGTFR